jgi:transposase
MLGPTFSQVRQQLSTTKPDVVSYLHIVETVHRDLQQSCKTVVGVPPNEVSEVALPAIGGRAGLAAFSCFVLQLVSLSII